MQKSYKYKHKVNINMLILMSEGLLDTKWVG